ncbi:MAG: hypothetical protein QXM43_02200 [Desulfurococcaceae archaeon]
MNANSKTWALETFSVQDKRTAPPSKTGIGSCYLTSAARRLVRG